MGAIRKIIHIDMDAFYASVEQRDNPELKGKPVVVGSPAKRGVIAAASYEARKYGIHSAMASVIAKQKCPELIFLKPRFDVYKSVSAQIMSVFKEYTDLVEPLSLDEAFLDVTSNKKGITSATRIAKEIKQKIKKELSLNASAGISINKFLAKVASDMDKPNGLYVIHPKMVDTFIDKLPIEKIPGIGKVTQEKMKSMKIFTGKDLKKKSRVELVHLFGKPGGYYYDILRNEHAGEVKPNRVRKSVGSEETFSEDLVNVSAMLTELKNNADSVWNYLSVKNITGKTVTIKIKYFDFVQTTRCKTLPAFMKDKQELYVTIEELLLQNKPEKPVRLLGVSVSHLNIPAEENDNSQLTLKF